MLAVLPSLHPYGTIESRPLATVWRHHWYCTTGIHSTDLSVRSGRHSVCTVAMDQHRPCTGSGQCENDDCDSATVVTVTRAISRNSVNYGDAMGLQSEHPHSPLRQQVCATPSHYHCSAATIGSDGAAVAMATTTPVPLTAAQRSLSTTVPLPQLLIDCCYQRFSSAHCCLEPLDRPLRLLVQHAPLPTVAATIAIDHRPSTPPCNTTHSRPDQRAPATLHGHRQCRFLTIGTVNRHRRTATNGRGLGLPTPDGRQAPIVKNSYHPGSIRLPVHPSSHSSRPTVLQSDPVAECPDAAMTSRSSSFRD
jgi:hypothetical protein